MTPIDRLTKTFSNFPSIGKRTAGRFIFHLIKLPREQTTQFLADLVELFKIKSCPTCFFPVFKSDQLLCEFCSDSTRHQNLICVIEKENDLLAIENTKRYKGVYHVLGGTLLSFTQEESSRGLRITELLKRIKLLKNNLSQDQTLEIILALRPDTAGDATNLYLDKYLKPLDIKITRLARGLPTGADLEYADEITLTEAINKRS